MVLARRSVKTHGNLALFHAATVRRWAPSERRPDESFLAKVATLDVLKKENRSFVARKRFPERFAIFVRFTRRARAESKHECAF